MCIRALFSKPATTLGLVEQAILRCVGELIVQGDEGPVGEVAQGVHCHGVTVSHEEKEEEEIEQEVEGEKEEKRSNNNAHVHGWDDYGRQVRTTWAMWNVM